MATTSKRTSDPSDGPDLGEIRRLVHDLNNVLVAVRGFAEIVATDAREGRVEPRDADQAVAAARDAIELVDALQAHLDGRRPIPER
jgi:hypothetical protein